ncbi:hypothetical protein E2C01_044195 [Portunus trituberculatus]|uniref:Uncharacterized protein n=1 Tax=Portunus trituberculatus TaxID=210409 RepID=A0A5B7FY63_PORTR|nr:hypothetical protein [Portunus trituberculatus]
MGRGGREGVGRRQAQKVWHCRDVVAGDIGARPEGGESRARQEDYRICCVVVVIVMRGVRHHCVGCGSRVRAAGICVGSCPASRRGVWCWLAPAQLGYHGYRMTTKTALGRAAHLLIVDKLITTPTPNGRRHTCSPARSGVRPGTNKPHSSC